MYVSDLDAFFKQQKCSSSRIERVAENLYDRYAVAFNGKKIRIIPRNERLAYEVTRSNSRPARFLSVALILSSIVLTLGLLPLAVLLLHHKNSKARQAKLEELRFRCCIKKLDLSNYKSDAQIFNHINRLYNGSEEAWGLARPLSDLTDEVKRVLCKEDIHKIALKDLKALNCDRQFYQLNANMNGILIDNTSVSSNFGGLLSQNAGSLKFEWMTLEQSRQPFSPELKDYVESLDFAADEARMVQNGLDQNAIERARLAAKLLKAGVESGLSAFQIGEILISGQPEQPIVWNTDSRDPRCSYFESCIFPNRCEDNIAENVITEYVEESIQHMFRQIVEPDATAREANERLKEFLVDHVEANGVFDLKGAFLEYLDTCSSEDYSYAIRFLSQAHDKKVHAHQSAVDFFNDLSKELTERSYRDIRGKPSDVERETPRAPMAIMVDLLAFLKDSDVDYTEVEDDIKSIILTHQATTEIVDDFLEDLQERFNDSPIADKCRTLQGQLVQGASPALLNDNIYGRVIDTSFAAYLVENTPESVKEAMTSMSQGFAAYLETLVLSEDQRRIISKGIKDLLEKKEPRFWFPAVPNLQNLPSHEVDELAGLIEYVRTPKTDGVECISIPYLIVKISIILKINNMSPPWQIAADIPYFSRLHPQSINIRVIRYGEKPLNSRGAGITLRHHPPVVDAEWMIPSERPTTLHRPKLIESDERPDVPKSVLNALQHGMPWASGMSGSTNIDLHAWDYFNRNYEAIDRKAALLGIIMFLVYDGGHSIHEPLWAASHIDEQLGLNFGLGGTEQLEDFISDYERFINIYEGNLKEEVSQAMEAAFDNVVSYFNQHSYYAANPSRTLPS